MSLGMFLFRKRRTKAREQGPGGQDRRESCRYPAVLQTARLRWESQGVRLEEPAVLENVSFQGCLAKLAMGPGDQPGLRVWLRSPAFEIPDGIEGELIAVTKSYLGVACLRIRFFEPLTFAAFKNLVYGPDEVKPTDGPVPECEWDIYWR